MVDGPHTVTGTHAQSNAVEVRHNADEHVRTPHPITVVTIVMVSEWKGSDVTHTTAPSTEDSLSGLSSANARSHAEVGPRHVIELAPTLHPSTGAKRAPDPP